MRYTSYRQMIEETYLPQCLAIGIRVEDFWGLNIKRLRPFLKAEEIKFQQKNREYHLLGQYIFDAVSISLANSFRQKGQEYIPYLTKPYEFLTEEEMAERKRKAELEQVKAKLLNFAENTRKRLENGERN